MRKYFDVIEEDSTNAVETAGFESIVDILKEQEETKRAAIEAIQTLSVALIETFRLSIEKDNQNAQARLNFEKHKFERQLEERNIARSACISQPIENDVHVQEASLASKGGASAKSKAKSRSGAGKKSS